MYTKEAYLNKVKNNFKCNPKSFYDFVNLKRKTSSKPCELKAYNNKYVFDTEIVECFSKFFASVFSYDNFPQKFSYPYNNQKIDLFVYILVFGDFNLPSISWLSLPDSESMTTLTPSGNSNHFSFNVVNRFCDLDFHQINSVENSYGKILNLAF